VSNIVARADQSSFGVSLIRSSRAIRLARRHIVCVPGVSGWAAAVMIGLARGWYPPAHARAAIMIGTARFCLGRSGLWQFYVIYGVFVGSMGHAAFSVLLPVIMTRWFYRHLGTSGVYWACQASGW
jgi:hypothetical protein